METEDTLAHIPSKLPKIVVLNFDSLFLYVQILNQMLIEIQLEAANFMLFHHEWNLHVLKEASRYVRQVRVERVCRRHEHFGREELPDLPIIKAVPALAFCDSEGEADLVRVVICFL